MKIQNKLVAHKLPVLLISLILATMWFLATTVHSTPNMPAGNAIIEPGGAASDASLALSDPDEYAWNLFFFINRQALPGFAGVADGSKSITQYGVVA